MRRNWKEAVLVTFIIAIAAGLRLWSLGYDLPYVVHPDEPAFIRVPVRMFHSGDLNSHFFGYPTLYFYLNMAGYALYYGFGRLTGAMTTRMDVPDLTSIAMGSSYATDPAVVLIGRYISLILGVATVLLVYLMGRRVSGRWATGAVAAMLLAVSPTHIYNSRLVTFDVPATFFTVWAMAAAIAILQEGRTRDYVATAVLIGLAFSTKYNVGLVAVVLPVAHFLRTGAPGWRDVRLYLSAPVAALTFLLINPYALLDYRAFSANVFSGGVVYAKGHAGMEGDTVRWYLNFLWKRYTILPLLAVAQIAVGFARRSKETILLASFPAVYFAFISWFTVRNDRTLLPILPFIFLLAAILLVDLIYRARRIGDRRTRRAAVAGLVIAAAILMAIPAREAVALNIQRQTETLSGPLAGAWIMENVPPGSRIAMESYGPFFDPSAFDLRIINGLIDQPPQWYIDEGFDYLVFSRGAYGRFFRDPERYADQIARYEELFASFDRVQSFRSQTTEILIYQNKR